MDSLLQNYNSDDDQDEYQELDTERDSTPRQPQGTPDRHSKGASSSSQDDRENKKQKIVDKEECDKGAKSNWSAKKSEISVDKRSSKEERLNSDNKRLKKKHSRSSSSESDSSSSSSSSSDSDSSSSDASDSSNSKRKSRGDKRTTTSASSAGTSRNTTSSVDTTGGSASSTKHPIEKPKMPSPLPERKSSVAASSSTSTRKRDGKSEISSKSPVKTSHSTGDKRRSSSEREKRRDRSGSRDRYDAKRYDRDRDRRDRDYRDKDRSFKPSRDRNDTRDADRRDKYSSRGSYKDDKHDKRDKYDRHERRDRDRSRDRKERRDYEKDRRYRRSSSRDRKKRSSTDRSRRRSHSKSKSPVRNHLSPPTKLPPQNEHPTTLPVTGLPSIKSLPNNPTAFIPPLMDLNIGPIELPLKPNTACTELPIDSTSTLSRSSLIRSNVKAAQLEKMGIDVLQQNKKATDTVPLPSYYNPGVVNPVRYADQVQKRKLLWSHKTAESKDVSSNISKWEQAKFSQDKDGKVASKFLRLMGVKSNAKPGEDDSAKPGTSSGDSIKKQEELFSTMEQQYEVARQATHTMRGVGLGFGSQQRTF